MSSYLDPAQLDLAWDFTDPVASEARLSALREQHRREPVAEAEAVTQISRALGLQRRFDDAHALLDTIASDEPVVQARLHLERGRLLTSAGQAAAAIPHFTAATGFAKAAGNDALHADALHMLAIADAPNAREWTREGLRIAHGSGDPRARRWRGALHNNLGWHLHDAGDFPAAMAEFKRALAAFQESGTPRQVHIAWWTVGRCLRSLGRYTDALTIQQRLAADDPGDTHVAAEIAELRRAMDAPDTGTVSGAAEFG